jgi:TolB-like protein/Tfp pilus assembly protein PilF
VDFEVGLNSAVRKLREALDDSADSPRFVETLPRRGYRFIASVSLPAAAPPLPLETAPPAAPAPSDSAPIAPIPPLRLTAAVSPVRLRLSRAGVLLLGLLAAAALVFQQWGFVGLRAGPEPIRALIVLPFENLTGDPAQAYFADRITDAITEHLARVDGLDVISRTSARQYADTSKGIPQIARELNVDGIVSATVLRSPAGVVITVRLMRAAAEGVWTRTYDGDLQYMSDLQQQIASDVAAAAGRSAPTPDGHAAARPIAPRAYDAYLKGLTAQGQQRFEGFRRAVAYFEEAVLIQPDYADAHAALALAQLQFLFGGPLSPREVIPRAEAAARRALELDDTLPRAHRALGQILALYYWRFEESDKVLDRLAELEGLRGDDVASPITASLRRRGRFEEAIARAERARRLDPLSVSAQSAVGVAYRAAGQHDRAVRELRQAIDMSPALPRTHYLLGVTFLEMGRLREAIQELEGAARPPTGHNTRIEAYLGYAYAIAGRPVDARAVLTELETHRREHYVSWFGTALILDALGEKEPALAALQRACQDHAVEFGMMDQYPPFKAIAAETGFAAVMRQVGRSPDGTLLR